MTVMEQQHLLLECGLSLVPSHITVTSLVLTHTHTPLPARLPAFFSAGNQIQLGKCSSCETISSFSEPQLKPFPHGSNPGQGSLSPECLPVLCLCWVGTVLTAFSCVPRTLSMLLRASLRCPNPPPGRSGSMSHQGDKKVQNCQVLPCA